MCRGKSEQSDGGHGQASSGQGEPRKYCSTASHAARNGVQAPKGLVFSSLEHPNTSESVWGEEKFGIQPFFLRVTPECCKLRKFCSVMMDERETRFSLSTRV